MNMTNGRADPPRSPGERTGAAKQARFNPTFCRSAGCLQASDAAPEEQAQKMKRTALFTSDSNLCSPLRRCQHSFQSTSAVTALMWIR